MTLRHLALAALALAAAPAYAQPAHRLEQAEANYRALLAGSLRVSDLNPQQLADVAAVDRRLRKPRSKRTAAQRCIDAEIADLGGAPSRLARRIIDMKCREPGD